MVSLLRPGSHVFVLQLSLFKLLRIPWFEDIVVYVYYRWPDHIKEDVIVTIVVVAFEVMDV